jgi:hypothetical protein
MCAGQRSFPVQGGQLSSPGLLCVVHLLLLQYYVHAICDDWMHAEYTLTLSFHGLVLPERMPPHTGKAMQ